MHNTLIQHLHFPSNLHQAQRLFHGRGHAYTGLEHVTVDWLSGILLITLFATESPDFIHSLKDALLEQFPNCHSILLQQRDKKNGPFQCLHGEEVSTAIVHENTLDFHLQLGKSRNTGLFLDMKNGRQWVQEHSKEKRVLNLFAYTCGFSVAAVAGGAQSVVNIDMSSAALSVGRKNHQLNQQSSATVRYEKVNIFKSFGRIKKRGAYDLLICDPPTFQSGSVNIERDYAKIMRRLNQFMAPHAQLMLCLNAPDLSKSFILDNMAEHAPQYTLINDLPAPEAYIDAQNKGLKVLCFEEK
ncbi:MAG: class I SAM-dependent methyltransferase [Thiotrichaceae bacterium]|nr:class I SAM-dependent methyltransferase [Thiotrichaceae bacterium]